MLQEEIITAPISNYRGPGIALWCMWHPAWWLQSFGKRWREVVIRDLAAKLHHAKPSVDCIAWIYTDWDADRHHVYLAFPQPIQSTDLLSELGRKYSATGTETNGSIPTGAVPVLKRATSGTLIRLWALPGPDIPSEQKVKADWEKLRFVNRCYVVQELPNPTSASPGARP